MKQIIALQQYTDKYVSLYEGEIRNISNSLADELIEKGIVKQHDDNENQQRANIKNLVDGNASGSIRTSNSTAEDSSYTLGYGAFAEGSNTTASGVNSHAEGYYTIANHANQHVFGEYNIKDLSTNPNTQRGNYVFIVGNGNSDHRSNAFAMKWDGTFVFADGTEITPAQFAALKALLN